MSTQRMNAVELIITSPEGVVMKREFEIPAYSRPWNILCNDGIRQLLDWLSSNLRAQDAAELAERRRQWRENKKKKN
jgi:hypothetical protein